MRTQLSEALQEINADLDLLGTKYANNRAIFNLIKYALNENYKFNLPEGMPDYPKLQFTVGYAPISLAVELLGTKLDIFCRKDLKDAKLSQLFNDLIQQLDVNDAEILVHIKDQNLNKLYKKFTKKLVEPYFTNQQ